MALERARRKVGAHSTVEAVLIGFRRGWLPLATFFPDLAEPSSLDALFAALVEGVLATWWKPSLIGWGEA